MKTLESRDNKMEQLTNAIVTAISKPAVGIASGASSGLIFYLSVCHIITITAATIGTVASAALACIHLFIWLRNRLKK